MYNILICDDEKDIVSALSIYLSTENYNIFTAYTGQEALDIVAKHDIHLILMDIMMPQMDGIAATVKLRETSNIPIILLTAKSEDSDKILGLNIGADDYITKPFHAELLISRIDNLIRQRECMRQAFRTEVNLEPSSVTATPVDEKFIRSCIDNIEEHISEPEFGVDDLCLNVGYSRPQLYRKIKSITGMSAIQFLRSIRLKRAAQLLSSGSGMTVTEVMYAVGFNNISYFSKIFFSEFGVLPKDYGKSL